MYIYHVISCIGYDGERDDICYVTAPNRNVAKTLTLKESPKGRDYAYTELRTQRLTEKETRNFVGEDDSWVDFTKPTHLLDVETYEDYLNELRRMYWSDQL